MVLVLTGCAPPPNDPTAGPTGTGPASTGVVTFPAEDGVSLTGQVYGAGTTAVVLSNMGDNDPGPWQAFAPTLAQRGYLVLTYSFRYPLRTDAFTLAMAQATVPDLFGAVTYVRGLGATRVVLIGASLGGITVGRVAGAARAVATVIISAGSDLSAYGLAVTSADLAAMTGPKLFIASEADDTVPYADTLAYFDQVPEPKEFQALPGRGHGVRIFATDQGDRLSELLLTFVTARAPVAQ